MDFAAVVTPFLDPRNVELPKLGGAVAERARHEEMRRRAQLTAAVAAVLVHDRRHGGVKGEVALGGGLARQHGGARGHSRRGPCA